MNEQTDQNNASLHERSSQIVSSGGFEALSLEDLEEYYFTYAKKFPSDVDSVFSLYVSFRRLKDYDDIEFNPTYILPSLLPSIPLFNFIPHNVETEDHYHDALTLLGYKVFGDIKTKHSFMVLKYHRFLVHSPDMTSLLYYNPKNLSEETLAKIEQFNTTGELTNNGIEEIEGIDSISLSDDIKYSILLEGLTNVPAARQLLPKVRRYIKIPNYLKKLKLIIDDPTELTATNDYLAPGGFPPSIFKFGLSPKELVTTFEQLGYIKLYSAHGEEFSASIGWLDGANSRTLSKVWIKPELLDNLKEYPVSPTKFLRQLVKREQRLQHIKREKSVNTLTEAPIDEL